jgi:hypothetical protein
MKTLRNRNSLYILALMTCFYTGCHPKKEVSLPGPPKFVAEVNTKDETVFNWDERAVLEEVIPLETTNNSLLNTINKFMVHEDKFYVFDFKNFQLLEFHNDGKFSKKIGKRGKGPGEYHEVRDFDIKGNFIYILDYKKIHRYDKHTGKFVDTKKLKIDQKTALNPKKFIILNDHDYYLWSSNPDTYDKSGEYNRLFFFKNDQEAATYFPYDYKIYDGPRFYEAYDGSYYMKSIDGDYDIFKITGETIINELKLNFGSRSLPVDYVKNHGIVNGGAYIKHDSFKGVDNIRMLSDSYLYFNCSGPGSYTYEGLVNTKTNQVIFGKMDFPINPILLFADEKDFYGYFEPSWIEKYMKVETNNTLFEKFKDMTGTISASDNPVIVKYSFIKD